MIVSEIFLVKVVVIEFFCNEGMLVVIGGNYFFLIDDLCSVWFVEEGQVNIFIVGVENGELVGV